MFTLLTYAKIPSRILWELPIRPRGCGSVFKSHTRNGNLPSLINSSNKLSVRHQEASKQSYTNNSSPIFSVLSISKTNHGPSVSWLPSNCNFWEEEIPPSRATAISCTSFCPTNKKSIFPQLFRLHFPFTLALTEMWEKDKLI